MRAGYIAIGLTAVVGVVPASFAQSWQVLSKSAGTAIEDKQRQTHQGLATNSGISVAEPIGSVSLNPDLLDGEPIYVRRTTVTAGMTVVEVSTTPFMPVLASNEGTIGRPDQPASW